MVSLDILGNAKMFPSSNLPYKYVNMSPGAPSSGLRFHKTGTPERGSAYRKTDGSWLIRPHTDGLQRCGLNSFPNRKWVNIEMTAYMKPVSGAWQFQLACMGGVHSSISRDNRKWGSAYKARFLGNFAISNSDPRRPPYMMDTNCTYFVKELAHGCYAEVNGQQAGYYGGVVKNIPVSGYNFDKWQGYKFVKYTYLDSSKATGVIGRHPVWLGAYVDVNCENSSGTFYKRNNWQLVNSWVDKGIWSCATQPEWRNNTWKPTDMDNLTGWRRPNEIINTGGDGYVTGETNINDCYIRTDDNTVFQLRDMTVREIVPDIGASSFYATQRISI